MMKANKVRDLYCDIAPAIFAEYDKKPIPLHVSKILYLDPETATSVNDGETAIAQTHFSDDLVTAEYIAFNGYYLPCLTEPEVWAILVHEIAHAVGVFADQHYFPWRKRAGAIHPAAAQAYFIPLNRDAEPYNNLMWVNPAETPTIVTYPI
jgi:hypothetical protein